MDFFENRYFNANRVTLSMIGAWPYQSMRHKVAIRLFFTITYGTLGVLAFWKWTRMHITLWFVAYSFQYFGLGLMLMSNLIYGWVCMGKLRRLLDHIKCDWNLFEPCDVEMIEPYTEFGRKCTIGLTVVCALLPFSTFLESKRSDNGLNSNVTVHKDVFETFLPFELVGINYEKYYIPVLSVIMVLSFFALLTTLALGTLYLACVLHACGMFSIAGRRMETMFDDLQEDVSLYKKRVILLFFQSIMLHARAINFTNTVNSFYGPLYMTKVVFVIILLSIDILQMTHAYNNLHEMGKVLMNLTHFCGILVLTGVFCYTGQTLLDHSNGIFFKIYTSRWYAAPLDMRKLVIIIMARSLRESGITLTKSITASFELFAAILQMALSYFMAINSLQDK